MNLQGFVVGFTKDDKIYDLAPVPRDEEDLAGWYTETTYARSAFDSQRALPGLDAGVHLHWAIPAALTRSIKEDTKDPEQPYVPNRWLVLRMWRGESALTVLSKGWVIESDAVSRDESGGRPFPFFVTAPPADLQSQLFGYVGRTESIDKWSETHPEYRFKLTSFGWGDPSFAAYYPACKGIFGFHDRLKDDHDKDLPSPCNLSYLVLGWYSDRRKDPLDPPKNWLDVKDCVARLESLRWSCNFDSVSLDVLPKRTLCTGSVVGIPWQRDSEYKSFSRSRKTTVVIGSSANEALAALLTPGEKPQQVLCAFQDGQASQVSDHDQLRDLLHRQGFSAVPGGKQWTVDPIKRMREANSPSPTPSANVRALLQKLNESQRKSDKHARDLESLRSQLFADWVGRGTNLPPQASSRTAVNDFWAALVDMENQVESLKKEVRDALGNEGSQMELVESTMPPFLHPKDPFFAIESENLISTDRSSPQSLRKHSDENDEMEPLLPCRYASQLISGLSFSSKQGHHIWEAAKFVKLNFPASASQDKMAADPGTILLAADGLARKLALETLLFDPHQSAPPPIDANSFTLFQRGQLTEKKPTLAWVGQRSDGSFRAPDPLGITFWDARGRSNPFLPVYLMWQAQWLPDYGTTREKPGHTSALSGWRIDPNQAPAGHLADASTGRRHWNAKPALLEGVTIISTLSGRRLAKTLKKFASGMASTVAEIERTAVIGQSLGGLNDQLIGMVLGLFLPPINENGVDTSLWEAMGETPQSVMPSDSPVFFPVRSGALKLEKLWIADCFGQVAKVIDPSTLTPQVSVSALLPAPPPSYDARFVPRLVQPARLNFEWDWAKNAASGPLCGWIVPNFLEQDFAVFSAAGTPLGTLRSHGAMALSGNQHLDRFLSFIRDIAAPGREEEWSAFRELVEVIFRKADEGVPPKDPALAVLLGRPLALVRASLSLELHGLPLGYWRKGKVRKFVTEDFEKLRVPVRLGGVELLSDGLVGYLLDGGEPRLCASAGSEAFKRPAKGIDYTHELAVIAGDGQPISMTLLMETSARVHATCGILPRTNIVLPPEIAGMASFIEEVAFSVAPVLGERPRTEDWKPTMPRPSDAFGQWSWSNRPAITVKNGQEIRPADDRAHFADDPCLLEGWLKLRLKREA
jgi:hypothetical protein